MRLAPFLLLGVVLFGCGPAAPGSAPDGPAAADVEEVSFQISALM